MTDVRLTLFKKKIVSSDITITLLVLCILVEVIELIMFILIDEYLNRTNILSL